MGPAPLLAVSSPTLTASALLKSLNSGAPTYDRHFIEQLGIDKDQIHSGISHLDLREVYGITVAVDPNANESTAVEVSKLDESTIAAWFQKARNLRAAGRPHLKLLWGEQIFHNDSLRAWTVADSVRLSKDEVTECLDLQSIAIEKMGTEMPWILRLPQGLSPHKTTSHFGLSANRISATWSYDAASKATSALIVGRRSSYGRDREIFLESVESLRHLYHLPAYLPFAIASTEVAYLSEKLAHHERAANSSGREVAKLLYNQEPLAAFGESSARMQTLLSLSPYAKMVIEMAEDKEICLARGPLAFTPSAASSLLHQPATGETDCDLLLQALDLRVQELKSLCVGVERLKDRTASHLSCILGMISFHQQRVGQEIAEATQRDGKVMKDIAEATRKDSTSMKVLALVTIIFLPSTATSTIMAIPNMFDFSGSGVNGPLVSSRFWIFFAVAVPLTMLTGAITWLWLRWEKLGRPLSWKSIATPPGDADAKTLV